eukprot:m.86947 g.86947  ORF g.86947 m.86947 type:complete len:428 (-) comp13077_c0_seq3:71-1354(-)
MDTSQSPGRLCQMQKNCNAEHKYATKCHKTCEACLTQLFPSSLTLAAKCPTCMQQISIFEVIHERTGKKLRAPTPHDTPLGHVYKLPNDQFMKRATNLAFYFAKEGSLEPSYHDNGGEFLSTVIYFDIEKLTLILDTMHSATSTLQRHLLTFSKDFNHITRWKHFYCDYEVLEDEPNLPNINHNHMNEYDWPRGATEYPGNFPHYHRDFELVEKWYTPGPHPHSFTSFGASLLFQRIHIVPNSCFGQTFTQGGLGIASYHFPLESKFEKEFGSWKPPPRTESACTLWHFIRILDLYEPGVVSLIKRYAEKPEGPYINYNSAPQHWVLSDGSRPPSKKYFEDPHYDPVSRTFRGNITWHPLKFGLNSKWTYKMVFSANFSSIEEGYVECYNSREDADASDEWELSRIDYFDRNLAYWRMEVEQMEARI